MINISDKKLKIKKGWQIQAAKFGTDHRATIRDIEFRKLNTLVVSRYLNKNDRCLDIACGNGFATAQYAQKVKFALGIDYLPEFIELANKKHQKLVKIGKLAFRIGDILKLDLKGEFDKIICERTLNNLTSFADHKKAVLNLHKALKKNGLLLLVEPTVQGHQSVDKVRTALGLPKLTKYWNNFYLDEVKFEKFIKPYFKIEKKIHFGTYHLISKILYPLYVYPKEQKFRSKFNRLARLISQEYLEENGVSHTVLYVLRKR